MRDEAQRETLRRPSPAPRSLGGVPEHRAAGSRGGPTTVGMRGRGSVALRVLRAPPGGGAWRCGRAGALGGAWVLPARGRFERSGRCAAYPGLGCACLLRRWRMRGVVCPGVHCVARASAPGPPHLSDLSTHCEGAGVRCGVGRTGCACLRPGSAHKRSAPWRARGCRCRGLPGGVRHAQGPSHLFCSVSSGAPAIERSMDRVLQDYGPTHSTPRLAVHLEPTNAPPCGFVSAPQLVPQ